MLTNYPKGTDLTILNTIYLRPKQIDGKYDDGSMTLIYKDNKTGKKSHNTIYNPDFNFYVYKDGSPETNLLFTHEDTVDQMTVEYKDLEKSIAEMTNNMDFYYDNIRCNNRYANKRLHTIPKLFMSDEDVSDQYRRRFAEDYSNTLIPISKSYLDIEADTINMKGDFPELGECPINAVTVIFEHINRTFTFLLRNPNNPLIEIFEKDLNGDTFKKLKDFIRDGVGGWKNEVRFGLADMEYSMLFYDDEVQMLQDLFIAINQYQPDFVLAWNMAFDIPYIIERLKILGIDPASVICHPDFEEKVARYFIDERHKNEYAERGDYATISSYSVYMDQMLQFASRRKGQHAFESMRLDDIGRIVAKVRKLDYSNITTSIAQLPYLDYETFVFYNIFDTIVQKCIEKKSGDIEYIFGACLVNNTRYSKGHRQTIYLTNRGASEFKKDGFIMGNNANKFKEKPEDKYPGAFVADPLKINNYSKLYLNGAYLPIYYNGDDFDYKSLYPSIARENNTAPNTLIGMIQIDTKIDENENIYNVDKVTRGGLFIEDYTSGNILQLCHRWFNLADYSSLYDDILEYYNTITVPTLFLDNSNEYNIVNFYDNHMNMKRNIITFGNVDNDIVSFYKSMPNIVIGGTSNGR